MDVSPDAAARLHALVTAVIGAARRSSGFYYHGVVVDRRWWHREHVVPLDSACGREVRPAGVTGGAGVSGRVAELAGHGQPRLASVDWEDQTMTARRRRSRTLQPDSVASMLDRVVDRLESSSGEVFALRCDMKQWELLSGQLCHYNGAGFIERWWNSHVLSSCRRIVDRGDDVISPRGALALLLRIADDVTAEEIAAHRHRRPHEHADSDATAEEIDSQLRQWIPDHQPRAAIGKPVVQRDLTSIRDVAERLWTLTTHRIAHRTDKPVGQVTWGEVEELLVELESIYKRWIWALRGKHVAFMHPDEPDSPALLRALELFEWDEYVPALYRALDGLGPAAPTVAELEAKARIEYRFD